MKFAQCVFRVQTTGISFAVLAVLCIGQFSPSAVSAMEPFSLADVIERVKPVVVNISATGGSDNSVPADERIRVLERFYRLDASRTKPGAGLGLSLVAAVAKLHDATLLLSENHPGLQVALCFGPGFTVDKEA